MNVIVVQYSQDNDPVIDLILVHHGCMLRAKLKNETTNNSIILHSIDGRAMKIISGLNTLVQSPFSPYFGDIKRLEDIREEIDHAHYINSDLIVILPFNKNFSETLYSENDCSEHILTAMIIDMAGEYKKTIYI